ncbi:MAG TPA: hypothetical protein VMF32_17175 [Xanthobacteraceae bacterium]|nr:hypothetical protein [Xanthobacteraceae bacterium]
MGGSADQLTRNFELKEGLTARYGDALGVKRVAISDFVIMLLHWFPRDNAGRVEFDYLFGNLFFIDVPTLSGVVLIMNLSSTITHDRFGIAGDAVVQALAGGGIVMHVVVSQIVFSFLQVQLRVNRLRPALSPA